MRVLRSQRGQTSAEYLGVVVVVAIVIGALATFAPGIGDSVRSGIGCAVESITGGGACGGGAAAGVESAGGDRDDGNFLTGAGAGLRDLGGELWGAAKGIGRHVNVFDPDGMAEQWSQTAATAKQVVTHPWESTKTIASSFWDPIAESYAHGGLDEALGRGVVTGAGAVVGGKGLTKLGRAGRVADAAPESRRTPDAEARRRDAERANCASNSFTAGTTVLMAWGERRPIARVEVGERVLATEPGTGQTGGRVVERVIVGAGPKTLVRVRIGGKVIAATDRHPFWVESRRAWADARDLRSGDVLREPDGDSAAIESVRVLAPRAERVYNLTVSGTHTYYAGAAPVLVHNANCPDEDERSFGTGRPPHSARVTVTRDGQTRVDETLRSGEMTPEERALGFPRSSLATHTEARAVRQFPLRPGDSMNIRGEYPPCPSCKGAMNRAAREQGATITYEWPGGTWTAGARNRRSP